MAKTTKAAVAEKETVAPAETTAIALAGTPRKQNAALATLAGTDADDKRGTEGIDAKDLIIPRLALCQSNSPQRKRGNEKFIAGLEEGMMFNSLTGDIYEEETDEKGNKLGIPFIPIKLRKHAIEFRDLDLGGGIVDRNVPFNDKRCEYDNTKEGKEAKPKATRFYDWLGYLPETGELVVASFKGTSEKAGKKIATLSTTVRPGPTFGHLYRISTASKSENNYDWHLFTVVPAGAPAIGDAVIAEQAFERFKGDLPKYDEDVRTEEADVTGGQASSVAEGVVSEL